MPSFTMAVRILAKALSVTWTPLAGGFGAAVLVSASIMPCPTNLLRCHHCWLRHILLLLPVVDGGADRVFRQHRAVNLHGWKRELFHDFRVFDLQRFVHG